MHASPGHDDLWKRIIVISDTIATQILEKNNKPQICCKNVTLFIQIHSLVFKKYP
jgi:hypothetical protein